MPRCFEDSSDSVSRPPLARPPSFLEARTWKRSLLAEQVSAWEQGDPIAPESLLARWPTDPSTDPDAASLLIEDLLQRRRRGEASHLEDYEGRFPEHARSLASLASYRAMTRSVGGAGGSSTGLLRLPEVGDELFGFLLRHPLGSGAFARVYLAEQADLAERPVVLKISAIEGTEPQTLAQLQHTNIVPIYSVHEDARAGLRAVCMPYFGGDSLSSLLEHLWRGDHRPVHGSEVVAALKEVQAPTPEALKDHGDGRKPPPECSPDAEARTPLALWRELSYVQTSAWIVAQLAEGLHHAHQRGILHRDIKPSNVLISAEGQPLLLDFNLAYERDGDPAQATLGGTVAYMAPEHLLAMVGRSPALTRQVDERSDLYSLGMILGELLTGHRLFDHSGSYSVVPLQIEAMAVERSKAAPSMRSQRPDIPWSLESIAKKCLAPDPSRRYQQADHLAEDLRRFLGDCPLKHAPELSRVERVRKYFRRHPRLTSSGSVATAAFVVLLAVGSALAGVRGHLTEARARLGTVQARDRREAHEDGTVKALCLVNTSLDLQDHLRQGAAVCEQTLALYDVPRGDPGAEHPDWAGLDPTTRRRLAEDRRELLSLLAGARVRLSPGDRGVLRQALALLDRAEAIRGLAPSKALWLDRAHYLGGLGELEGAESALREANRLRVTTARDHYQLATAYARRGGPEGFARAVAELDEAIRLDPRHYWSLVQRGICHLELGEYVPAALDFGVCTGLWPEFAWGYFNRGYVLDRSGRKAEAVADYTAALGRDPRLVPAHVNRGLARLELKRYAAALSDFDAALAMGRDDPSLSAGRGIALEAMGRHDEADEAFKDAFARVPPRRDPARARLYWTYGFAVAARLPARSREAFDEVLLQDPKHLQALYGRAMLAAEAGRLGEAIRFFDRALDASPGYAQARRSRAVLLARAGEWARATRDVNWGLERDPDSGDSYYAAACVAALASVAFPDPKVVDQALDLLQRAVARGADLAKVEGDRDLAAIRPHPRFKEWLARTRRAESPTTLADETR